MNPDRAMDYLDFVVERHKIWERRQAGELAPWTKDPVLATKSFTNVFRVLDHDSQWLLTHLLDGEPRDVLMRCFLFRHTGRVEAWEYARAMLGDWWTAAQLSEVRELFREYRGPGKKVARTNKNVLPGRYWMEYPRTIFTSAYLVFPQTQERGSDKLDAIFGLAERLFDPSSPTDVVPDFLVARTQAERFAVLRRNKGVADFMSYQVSTDINYSVHGGDRENEFVVAGPGSRKGAMLLEPTRKPEDMIRWAQATLHQMPDCPRIQLPDGSVRLPSLADCQNLYCEYFKYNRYNGKPGPKPYAAQHSPVPPQFPTHWSTS